MLQGLLGGDQLGLVPMHPPGKEFWHIPVLARRGPAMRKRKLSFMYKALYGATVFVIFISEFSILLSYIILLHSKTFISSHIYFTSLNRVLLLSKFYLQLKRSCYEPGMLSFLLRLFISLLILLFPL